MQGAHLGEGVRANAKASAIITNRAFFVFVCRETIASCAPTFRTSDRLKLIPGTVAWAGCFEQGGDGESG